MSYNLSVVLLIPDAYREAINQLAEYMGYGPDNLSVPLEDAQGAKWWGCRTGANPTFLSDFGAVLNPEVPEARNHQNLTRLHWLWSWTFRKVGMLLNTSPGSLQKTIYHESS